MQRLSRGQWRSIVSHLSILLLVVGCSAASVGGQTASCSGDFSETCSDLELDGGSRLEALCGDGRGSIQTTSLDLDEHITNNNGKLECTEGGGAFSASCQSASLSATGTLSAYCLDTSGNLVFTTLDLNECVQNSFGDLTWACL